jgi:hypothetical protein
VREDKMNNEIKENNSIMKCCICNNYKKGEFIVINDKKYHLDCITNLQDRIDKAIEYNNHLIKDAKYHLNLGHLKKMNKILKGDSKNE